jgi:RNA polymerase sigma-70 factor (ECF subfamily)
MTLDIQRCLLRLPEEQRAVLLLVSVEDLSYGEVARITGVPLGTVMSRLSRARSRLRELMEGRPDKLSNPPVLRRLK